MTDRERLIEILRKPIFPHELVDPIEAVADYLLDNGVTVQKWIPASEPPKTPGKYIVKIREGTAATTLLYDAMGGWYEMDYGEPVYFHVTHWMPLPEKPKEDET